MPKTEPTAIGTCLKEARLNAGYANRGTASTAVPLSPETIGRHERGEVLVTPDDAIQYAKGYDRPDIMLRFCADCPIGRNLRPPVIDRDLPFASLRVSRRLRMGAGYADRLEEIADDGIVDENEKPDFTEITTFLRSLEETTADVMLWALSQGIHPEIAQKKEPSCVNRNGSTG